jgi:O-antigen/teichoic acid export membrane protein
MHRLLSTLRHPFLQSSFIVLSGSLLINILNYAYNLICGRLLPSIQYGELISLITLISIVGVSSGTISNLFAKHTAHYQSLGDSEQITELRKSSFRGVLALGFALVVLVWVLTPIISHYLTINTIPLVLFALIWPSSLLAAMNKGMLQGMHSFKHLSLVGIVENLSILLLTTALILGGLSVTGAMLSYVLGMLISFYISSFFIRKALTPHPTTSRVPIANPSWLKRLPPYLGTIFMSTFLLAVFANVDVLLAKHYLSPEQAGLYSGLAVIGKIMTYGPLAIITVMFPMASSSFAKNGRTNWRLLYTALGLVLAISLGILIFFIFWPNFVVTTLLGAKFLPITPYLKLIGIALMITTAAKVFIFYFMAAKQRWFIYPFILLSITQIVLIIRNHRTISDIVTSLLVTGSLLLLCMLIVHIAELIKERKTLTVKEA